MKYIFKTIQGNEYEITDQEREQMLQNFTTRNWCWIELPNCVAVHNSGWEIVPKKGTAEPATESEGSEFPWPQYEELQETDDAETSPSVVKCIVCSTLCHRPMSSLRHLKPLQTKGSPPEEKLEPAPTCCPTNSEIRYKKDKTGRQRFWNQCTVCGKLGETVKAADVENPEELLEVK